MKTYSEISGDGGSKIADQVACKIGYLNRRMENIKHKIAVVSGKGGVGKSSVTANLAVTFARRGFKVGIFDSDLNGSSIPSVLEVDGDKLERGENGYLPVIGAYGIRVMSIDFFQQLKGSPVSWEGPSTTSPWIGAMEATAIRELLADTEWGSLDYLFIDTPPINSRVNDISGLLPNMSGVILVTIPSDLSYRMILKTISVVEKSGLPIIGLVENMKGYKCSHCGGYIDLFQQKDMKEGISYLVPYLGAVPFENTVASLKGEHDGANSHSESFKDICERVIKYINAKNNNKG